ncbi:SGNH/GDSL hydrolase family protein [Phormidesmis priestleyi]|nr:SGNH/GDSL hydrolase family protein [Phormidesmis priestleyi]
MIKNFKTSLLTMLPLIGLFGLLNQVSIAQMKPDKLGELDWWRSKVKAQAQSSQRRRFHGCLFGDSISSGLGNPLGKETANFAMGGLSTVSLLEQLKTLKAANVQCQNVMIAIGTNDAWYSIRNDEFVSNLERIILLTRSMGASQITVVPAFYSTVEASRNPNVAGTVERVEEINALIREVADVENVGLVTDEIDPLFDDRSLRQDLTFDGVHLNEKGQKIYKRIVLAILN